jgi:hypothetical protein
MEPYYYLSKPEGALGKDTFCVNYASSSVLMTPIIALRHKHWVALLSSTAMLVCINGIPTVALGIFVTGSDEEGYYATAMNPKYTRGFEALVGLITVLIVLAVIIWKRESGVNENPHPFLTLAKYTKTRSKKNSMKEFITSLKFKDGDLVA